MRRIITTFGFAILALALGARPAGASYLVITQATSYVEYVNSTYQYAYNWTQPPAAGAGFHKAGGCTAFASCNGSGAIDTVGNAVYSFDRTSVSASTPADPSVGIPPYSANAAAYAVANLPAGTVGVSSSGTYLDYRFPNSGQNGGSANAFAQIDDVVHLQVSGVTPTQETDIGVTFAIDGNMAVNTAAGDSQGSLSSFFAFGESGRVAIYDDSISSSPNAYIPTLGTPTTTGWKSFHFAVRTPTEIIFAGTYAVTGSSADLGMQATLSDNCGLGTACNYDHTGAFSLTLPGNASFTSDSGVLLTQVAPEPTPTGLFAAGIAVVLFARLRRSRKQVNS